MNLFFLSLSLYIQILVTVLDFCEGEGICLNDVIVGTIHFGCVYAKQVIPVLPSGL